MRGYRDLTNPAQADQIAILETTYDWIETFIKTNGHSPTIFEIAEGLEIRYDAARRRLVAMQRLGWIVRDGRLRSIALKGVK